MKKEYSGLSAEKIDFGANDSVTAYSMPSTCIEIIANLVDYSQNKCTNPKDTTSYMWILDNPYGD